MFAPYLKDKFCHNIRNNEVTLIEFIKALKPILQTDAYGIHRRNVGIRDADIDIGKNGGKNRFGGSKRDCHTNSGEYHCRAGAFAVASGYNDVCDPANSREGPIKWTSVALKVTSETKKPLLSSKHIAEFI